MRRIQGCAKAEVHATIHNVMQRCKSELSMSHEHQLTGSVSKARFSLTNFAELVLIYIRNFARRL